MDFFNVLGNWPTSLTFHKIQPPPNVNKAFPSIPSSIKSNKKTLPMIQNCTSTFDLWDNSSYNIKFYVLVLTRKKSEVESNFSKKGSRKKISSLLFEIN